MFITRHLITSHLTGNIKARQFPMCRDDPWAEGRNHRRQIRLCCSGLALKWRSDISYCYCCQGLNMVVGSAGALLQASPRKLAVAHWEVSAERGPVISSAIYPLAVSSAPNSCPTSFTHLSRQNNNKEGDGNSHPFTKIVNLLKEKERLRLGSEWDKEHIWTDSCHPMGCIACQASLSMGFSRQDY